MKEKFVAGVIGAGKIGKLHINNLKKNEDVRIKMVSDLFADELNEWFLQSGVENITKDYKDILEDDEINAVFICSPTSTHADLIKQAAEKGKHIFCEKPISFSEEETLEAYRVVKEAGVHFQVGFNRRFDKNFAEMQKRREDGKIGDVHLLKITSRDPNPPPLEYIASSGGLFFDMTIHDFDMARFLVGEEVEEVYAQGANLVDPKIQEASDIDTAIITLTFKNGAIGVIDNSREAVYGYDQRTEIFGNKGALMAENEKPTNLTFYHKGSVEMEKPLHFFLERYQEAYINETNEFIQSVLENRNTSVGFKDGIMAQRIAYAANESFKKQKPVKVDNQIG